MESPRKYGVQAARGLPLPLPLGSGSADLSVRLEASRQ
jgi:hypothetical protein